MFRFIHAADIHLDSPLRGLERYEGAPVEELRGATRRALENLVALAVDEKVDFLLIAGDVFDGDWKDYNTGLFFVGQMARLREAGIPVYLISGNHDAASQISKQLRLPENVVQFSVKKPETKLVENLPVAIHGQGFAQARIEEDLSENYPDAEPDRFNIGLLHTCATGKPGHERYAPCSLDGLRAKNYQYWALGHVHNREVLSEEPWVVFPGNLQGRHARETGPKGCSLVTVDGREVVRVEQCSLDVVRWAVCEVDASGADTREEVLERIITAILSEREAAGDRLLAVRILVAGSCEAHTALSRNPEQMVNDTRALAFDLGEGEVWVEKVKLQTRPAVDVEALRDDDSPVGQLCRFVREIAGEPEMLAELASQLSEVQQKLPPVFNEGDDPLVVNDPDYVADLLPELERDLVTRLLSEESAS